MATAKKDLKQENCCECCGEHAHDQAINEIKKAGTALADLAKKAMDRYEKADNKTKRNIVTSVVAAAALIAGAIGAKKISDKRKK
jgi:ferric-dicitrate binding protein FerR (iron transport regulator)